MNSTADFLREKQITGYFCPLMEKDISEAFCYEINSVAFGLCKPSLVNYATDRQEAEPVCEKCSNRAM